MANHHYLSLDPRSIEVFITVMNSNSITQAAEKLDVTQSAVSHTLEKLRKLFSDPLFVRSGRTVTPTQKAIDLMPELESLLKQTKQLLQHQTFDPKQSAVHYKIATNDAIRDLLLPRLYRNLQQQSPMVTLEVLAAEVPHIEDFRDHQVDIILSPIVPTHGDLMVKRLFSDEMLCFYDDTVRRKPTKRKDFQTARYISLSFLKKIHSSDFDINKQVAIRVPNFSGIAAFLQGSDFLTVAPAWLTKTSLSDFAFVDWIFQDKPMNMYMIWHQKHQLDPQHRWLREQLFESVTQITNEYF